MRETGHPPTPGPRRSGLPGAKEKERKELGQKGREEFQVRGLQGLGPVKVTTGHSGLEHLL